jgi:toxin CptA
MPSAPAIGFEYRPSRALDLAFPVMGSVAIVAILSGSLAWWIELLLIAALLAYLFIERRCFRRVPVRAVSYRSDGGWSLCLPDGESVEAALVSSRVLGSLTVLRFAWSGGRAALALLPDNLDTDTHRCLRMRLREGGPSRPRD